MHILCGTVPSICQRTAEQQPLHMSGFLRVIYAILNASVILERNETRLARNEKCLARNETRLARNETRGGNLPLSGTVMMKAVGQRDMNIQEVMHHILSIRLVSSSFQVITTSLDGSRKVQLTADGSLNTEPSSLDTYAGRAIYETDFSGISNCNFAEFASNYFQSKKGIKKQTSPVVIKACPNYSSSPKGPSNATPVPIEINKMTYNQSVAFNIIRDHFLGSTNGQLFMILSSLGGSGKSFVLQAVTNLLNEQCKACAYFGIAAFNIKGVT